MKIEIQDIIMTAESCYLSVVQINVVPDEIVTHLYKITDKSRNTRLVPISDVKEKLLYICTAKAEVTFATFLRL